MSLISTAGQFGKSAIGSAFQSIMNRDKETHYERLIAIQEAEEARKKEEEERQLEQSNTAAKKYADQLGRSPKWKLL